MRLISWSWRTDSAIDQGVLPLMGSPGSLSPGSRGRGGIVGLS